MVVAFVAVEVRWCYLPRSLAVVVCFYFDGCIAYLGVHAHFV